jgi:hypothetical protein
MSQLFRRAWRVVVNGIDVTALDVEFEVEKSLRPEPNTASLVIYNLATDTREAIEALNLYEPIKTKGQKAKPSAGKAGVKGPKPGRIPVEISAGYETPGPSLIFRGDLRRAVSKKNGADWVTTIEGEDGGRSVLQARVHQSFPAGTTRLDVVRACADGLGLGLGNILEVQHLLTKPYTSATIVDGSADTELRGVLRRERIAYSIQNGVLQFHRVGQGLEVAAYELSSGSGLVGSPEFDANGHVTAKTLMLPNIAPGAYVSLAAKSFRGTYRVDTIKYTGQSAGDEWYAELGLLPG